MNILKERAAAAATATARVVLCCLLVASVATVAFTASVATDAVTETEQVAEADVWFPPWTCMAGYAIYLSGVIASVLFTTAWDWKFVWRAANITAGAAMNAYSCAWSLASEHSARAACMRSPSYYLGADFYNGIPVNAYYRYGPCGVYGT